MRLFALELMLTYKEISIDCYKFSLVNGRILYQSIQYNGRDNIFKLGQFLACKGPSLLASPSQNYSDVIMSTEASQITSLSIVCSTVYSGAYQRKHQSSLPLAFVRVIHRGPVNSPHKGPVVRKMFPFDDVIMSLKPWYWLCNIGWSCLPHEQLWFWSCSWLY